MENNLIVLLVNFPVGKGTLKKDTICKVQHSFDDVLLVVHEDQHHELPHSCVNKVWEHF